MARQDFRDRIARIHAGGGGAGIALAGEGNTPGGGFTAPADTPSNPNGQGPGILVKILIWLLLLPTGFVLAVLTRLFLDPDITPEAAHYIPLLVMVAGGHVLLFGGLATAVMARLRRKALNLMIFAGFTGYGIGSALLNYAIQ